MTVTEESRHRLHQALDRTIGEEEATTLMEHLPPVGWADVATKADLAHLQAALDARFEVVDVRFEVVDVRFDAIDQRFADVTASLRALDGRFTSLETRLTHQLWQFLAIIVAFGAILIGVLRYT